MTPSTGSWRNRPRSRDNVAAGRLTVVCWCRLHLPTLRVTPHGSPADVLEARVTVGASGDAGNPRAGALADSV